MPNPDFVKGKEKEGGRQKGTPNKFTDLKQAFLDVFEQLEKESEHTDKVKSLFKWVIKNDRHQGLFYQMISKMLPSNVTVDGDVKVIYEFENTMTEFFTEHGTCTVEEFVRQLESINGGGNGGKGQKLLAESVKTILPAKPD